VKSFLIEEQAIVSLDLPARLVTILRPSFKSGTSPEFPPKLVVGYSGLNLVEMPVSCIPNGLRTGRRPFITAIRSHRRAYNVAVVGGGITGLTAAWKLTQDPQCTGITLYEKSHRLGGWMESETIPVDGGKVVFEYGPRTLRWARPAAQNILEMVRYNRKVFCSDKEPIED